METTTISIYTADLERLKKIREQLILNRKIAVDSTQPETLEYLIGMWEQQEAGVKP